MQLIMPMTHHTCLMIVCSIIVIIMAVITIMAAHQQQRPYTAAADRTASSPVVVDTTTDADDDASSSSSSSSVTTAQRIIREHHAAIIKFEQALWTRYHDDHDPELASYGDYFEHLHRRIGKLKITEGFADVTVVRDDRTGAIKTQNISSYSLDKEVIVLCIRPRGAQHPSTYYPHNSSRFVLIHELAHIACPCLQHPAKYNRIFKKLLFEAVRYGLWVPEDYTAHPVKYCGVDIASCPLTQRQLAAAQARPLHL